MVKEFFRRNPTFGFPIHLDAVELEVMQYIWRREEQGAGDVCQKEIARNLCREPEAGCENIKQILHRLSKRGWLREETREGPGGRYRSMPGRHEVGEMLLDWIVSDFFDGNFNSDLVKKNRLLEIIETE